MNPFNQPPAMPPMGPQFGPGMPFGPQFVPPRMPMNMPPFGPGMSPQAFANQQFVPNFERPAPLDRSIGGIPSQDLGMRLRQAMARGEVTKVAMDRWIQEPWLAYPFLNRTMQTNDPMMAALGRWYVAASVGRTPEERRALAQQWEQTEPVMASQARALIQSVHSGLSQTIATQMATNEQLRKLRDPQSTNVLEGFGSKFVDYMRDWREHPLTAAGVVLGIFLIFRALKNKSIGTVLGVGALGIALYSFIRDQYGIEPLESLVAKPLEQWGMPTAAGFVRKTRDTIKRPFVPTEVEGSALSYLGNRMQINGEDEHRMLGVIWGMKPADFLQAHQDVMNAKMGSPNQRVNLPPAVRQILRQMGADQTLARKWGNYTDRQKADIFLTVSNKILAQMPGGMRFGTQYISDHFVTGAWVNQSGAVRGGRGAFSRTTSPLDSQVRTDIQFATRRADMNMGDVILATVMTEQDWQNIQGYKDGYSAMQLVNGLNDNAKRVLNWVQGHAGNAWDILSAEGALIIDNNVSPFLRRHGFSREGAVDLMDQAKIALGQVRNSGVAAKDFVVGSTPFRVSREGVLYVWDKGAAQWSKVWGDMDRWATNRAINRQAGQLPDRAGETSTSGLPGRSHERSPGGLFPDRTGETSPM